MRELLRKALLQEREGRREESRERVLAAFWRPTTSSGSAAEPRVARVVSLRPLPGSSPSFVPELF